MTLKIPLPIKEEIIRLAERDDPIETCGYLAGTDNDEVRAIFPMTNIDHSPEHFSFDPREQFRVVKEARQRGLKLVAVYHSHPTTPARLSEEDIRLANDPELVYIVYSLRDQEMRAFKVNRDKFITEERLEVLP